MGGPKKETELPINVYLTPATVVDGPRLPTLHTLVVEAMPTYVNVCYVFFLPYKRVENNNKKVNHKLFSLAAHLQFLALQPLPLSRTPSLFALRWLPYEKVISIYYLRSCR